MSVTYQTTVLSTGGSTTGIPVPDQVLEELGGLRPAVTVDVDGYRYTTTVGTIKGQALLSLSAARRSESGLEGGAEVTVTLALDDRPQVLEVPADLQAALDAAPQARTFFDGLAPSARKNIATQVTSAKAADTRARRIARYVEKLAAGKSR